MSATPAATRAAFALAEKFKLAIERKAAERKRKYEEAGVEVIWIHHGQYGQVTPVEDKDVVRIVSSGSGEDDAMEVEDHESRTHDKEPRSVGNDGRPRAYLVAYNVFVLTDPLHMLAQKAPWLVNRLPDPSQVHNEDDFFASRPARKDEGVTEAIAPTKPDGTSSDFTAVHPPKATILPAIDFAQRERDEMRELTKATEIIDNCLYLGNVKDCVPPYHVRFADVHDFARTGYGWLREEECIKGRNVGSSSTGQEKVDDPFDSTDNPMGYDVCIECRDPASLITNDQIHTAEMHLATLDTLWATQCRGDAAEGASSSTVPPRPPPSASAVLHMTFPASPPCLTYTHWHIMPVLNFLAGLLSPRQNPPSTRQKRILIYSVDGYTESSVLALFLLMKVRQLDLPEAYLELQVSGYWKRSIVKTFHILRGCASRT